MKDNKIIFGFIGDLAAGKSLACKYLQEKYKVNSYRFSTILRDVLKRIYIPESRQNIQELSTALRKIFGQDLLSKVIIEDVLNDPNKIVIAEGIRRPADIVHLEKLPNFILVYITADPKIRWQRTISRNENVGDNQKTFEEFLADEQAEADREIKALGEKANETIINNGSLETLQEKIEDLIKKYANKN